MTSQFELVDLEAEIRDVCRGLERGLFAFAGPTQFGVVLQERENEAIVVDPRGLLSNDRKVIENYLLRADLWGGVEAQFRTVVLPTHSTDGPQPQLPGLWCVASFWRPDPSRPILLQIWVTEKKTHCHSEAPVLEFLKRASALLSLCTAARVKTGSIPGLSQLCRYELETFAPHAVREAVRSKLKATPLHLRRVLSAVASLSGNTEEGRSLTGSLMIVEPYATETSTMTVRLQTRVNEELPPLKNIKHVGKLLEATEGQWLSGGQPRRWLLSDGKLVLGFYEGPPPQRSVGVSFFHGRGTLEVGGEPLCTVRDGGFKLAPLELDRSPLKDAVESLSLPNAEALTDFLLRLIRAVQQHHHGCSLVLDANETDPAHLCGHHIEPIRLLEADQKEVEVVRSLARLDGALYLSADGVLHAVGLILDGSALESGREDLAHGARYNSALRFTASHDRVVVVTVSEDGPVSVFACGEDRTRPSRFRHLSRQAVQVVALSQWLDPEA